MICILKHKFKKGDIIFDITKLGYGDIGRIESIQKQECEQYHIYWFNGWAKNRIEWLRIDRFRLATEEEIDKVMAELI